MGPNDGYLILRGVLLQYGRNKTRETYTRLIQCTPELCTDFLKTDERILCKAQSVGTSFVQVMASQPKL